MKGTWLKGEVRGRFFSFLLPGSPAFLLVSAGFVSLRRAFWRDRRRIWSLPARFRPTAVRAHEIQAESARVPGTSLDKIGQGSRRKVCVCVAIPFGFLDPLRRIRPRILKENFARRLRGETLQRASVGESKVLEKFGKPRFSKYFQRIPNISKDFQIFPKISKDFLGAGDGKFSGISLDFPKPTF